MGEKCVRNDAGELSLSDDDKMKAWVEHYSRLLDVEFEWPSDLLPEVPPVEGPPPPVTVTHIRKALNKMKQGKAAGPSGIISEMLKAAGEEVLEELRLLAEMVFSSGEIPNDWEESLILNLYKGKGEALDRGNYRGLKLTNQVIKFLELVLDSSIRKMVNIEDMQFGFVPGRGTTDAIFIFRQLQEKYFAANKPLYIGFVDLEKAFDRVPLKLSRYTLITIFIIYLQRNTPDTTPFATQKYKILYHATRVIFLRITIPRFYPPHKPKTQYLAANRNLIQYPNHLNHNPLYLTFWQLALITFTALKKRN